GSVEALYQLGGLYAEGRGVSRSAIKATKHFKMAAEGGHRSALYEYGVCLGNGEGAKQDLPGAVTCFSQAAEGGHRGAQHDLAMCYLNGIGVLKNPTAAVKWHLRAAKQGLASSQFRLAMCYMQGEGVRQRPPDAFNWMLEAANNGHTEAKFLVAQLYHSGQGVDKCEATAACYFAQAAEAGHAEAAKHYGICFAEGIGVKVDWQMAVKWLREAGKRGVKGMKELRGQAEKALAAQEKQSTSHAEHEAAWNAFVAQASKEENVGKLTASNVPVPNDHAIRAIMASENGPKAIRMRWHPDKFQSKFGRAIAPNQLEAALKRVNEVMYRVNSADGAGLLGRDAKTDGPAPKPPASAGRRKSGRSSV
ncbi:hypothetical protein CYMTET_5501, partial [Cymbomonas tetramitiformis]